MRYTVVWRKSMRWSMVWKKLRWNIINSVDNVTREELRPSDMSWCVVNQSQNICLFQLKSKANINISFFVCLFVCLFVCVFFNIPVWFFRNTFWSNYFVSFAFDKFLWIDSCLFINPSKPITPNGTKVNQSGSVSEKPSRYIEQISVFSCVWKRGLSDFTWTLQKQI